MFRLQKFLLRFARKLILSHKYPVGEVVGVLLTCKTSALFSAGVDGEGVRDRVVKQTRWFAAPRRGGCWFSCPAPSGLCALVPV